jgi:hypothetical protein
VTDPWGNPLPEPGSGPPPPAPPPGATPPSGDTPGSWWPGGPEEPPAGGHPPRTPYDATPPAPVEGMANGALVAGGLSLLCGLLGVGALVVGPIAIALGLVARRRIDASGGASTGRSRAVAGLALGVVGTVVSVVWLVVLVTNPDLMQDLVDRLDSTTTTTSD